MSTNSTTLIKNIQELICILDTDFANYKSVLDQIVAETIKTPKHTDALITFINSQLSNADSRRKGLILLQVLLPLCPDEFFEDNAIAWLNNSLKNCQYEACINDDAYKVITLLLDVCHRIPELNKCITSGITSKLLESITRIHYNNVETTDALKCLEICLKIYPGSCVPFKTSIEKFLLSFVDYKKSLVIVRLVGKCFHLFQQIGGGGAQGINYKENWKNQQLIVCATMQSLMDTLFESIMEVGLVQQDVVSVLNLPKITSREKFKIYSNRLTNLIIFLQEMLLGTFPTVKCISPSTILNIISRGLSVTSSTLGKHILNEAINLASHLFFIHKHLLQLLQALIISLGCNLIPYSPTICKTIINNLKCTKPKDAGNVKAFCDLRLTTYETLSLWMLTAKSASCVYMYADSLIPIILTDVSPVTNQLNLTVSNNTPKHLSKKARKKIQQEQIIQSNVAKNYSPINKKLTTTSSIYQIKVCCEAFETLQTILLTSGHSLKPVVHKQLQEFVIKLLLNIQSDATVNPYEDVDCKLSLYKTLTILVTKHHWNMSPPLNYAIYLLSKGQADLNPRISSCCTKALTNLNSFIHPSCTTLQFPLNLESLSKEFNLNEDENEIEINSEAEENSEPEGMNTIEMIEDMNGIENNEYNIVNDKSEEILNDKILNKCEEILNDKNEGILNNKIEETENKSEKISNKEIDDEVIEIEDNEETARKKVKISNDDVEFEEINGIKKDEENVQIDISDDEEEMKLVLSEEDPKTETIEIDENNDVEKMKKTDEVIDLIEEDLLSSFVDIVNE